MAGPGEFSTWNLLAPRYLLLCGGATKHLANKLGPGNPHSRYNRIVAVLEFLIARQLVIDKVSARIQALETEFVPLLEAVARVLAESASADRDYPPLDRSVRDGYALVSGSLPGTFQVIGEVQAGCQFVGDVGPGQAVEIMTGAPIPAGADQVVMVEHVELNGGVIHTARPAAQGEFINPRGSETKSGQQVVAKGSRLNYASIAMLATVGLDKVNVYRRPTVAILSTGDEIVGVTEQPAPHQIRNSNSYSIAAQVIRAGGIPIVFPVVGDSLEQTRKAIKEGMQHDFLLLSGGVSAGKYDFVEPVLAELGAEFYFEGVLIQPGKPLVFGSAGGKFFFGLPGNPGSTMVTFELFARPALELLSGQASAHLPVVEAELTKPFRHKTGLTRFLPAHLSSGGAKLTPLRWQGSSDVVALSGANCFLVADPNRESWQAGDHIQVLLQ